LSNCFFPWSITNMTFVHAGCTRLFLRLTNGRLLGSCYTQYPRMILMYVS
jgi:hypothetical protein